MELVLHPIRLEMSRTWLVLAIEIIEIPRDPTKMAAQVAGLNPATPRLFRVEGLVAGLVYATPPRLLLGLVAGRLRSRKRTNRQASRRGAAAVEGRVAGLGPTLPLPVAGQKAAGEGQWSQMYTDIVADLQAGSDPAAILHLSIYCHAKAGEKNILNCLSVHCQR